MYDATLLIEKFHDEHVTLTLAQRQDMQSRRDTNVDRLKTGLKELDKPPIADTINQGGNAMQTMTQAPEADTSSRYDIDLGVVFEGADALTPATTKSWVRDAIAKKATNLKTPPEAKKKCVRVIYSEGYQCDFPVFKRTKQGDGYRHFIAIGTDWLESDPKAVNEWFEKVVKEKSPESSGFQLRRITRLVKYFAKVHGYRTQRSFPAGLVVTALTVECYAPVGGRDDEALYKTLKAISTRSELLPVFANGVQVSGEKDKDRLRRLKDAAKEAVDALADLNGSGQSVTEEGARKAWKKVFRHSFFDSDAAKKCFNSAGTIPSPAIVRRESDRLYLAQQAAQVAAAQRTPSKPWNK